MLLSAFLSFHLVGENWQPRRKDRDLQDTFHGSNQGLDILALLVSIYGSTDLFIVEYRSLLANKLLANLAYITDKEMANLELLKIRFGDEYLHSCEVMLKDLEDSKRVNNSILKKHSERNIPMPVDYCIISENYWPNITSNDVSFRFHPKIQVQLSQYLDEYAVLKKPRKLHPIPNAGSVELDLDFSDGSTRQFIVSPFQANLISYFDQGEEEVLSKRSLHELIELLEAEEEDVLSGLAFWKNKRVIREEELSAEDEERKESSHLITTPNCLYVLIEEQRGNAATDEANYVDDHFLNEISVDLFLSLFRCRMSSDEALLCYGIGRADERSSRRAAESSGEFGRELLARSPYE